MDDVNVSDVALRVLSRSVTIEKMQEILKAVACISARKGSLKSPRNPKSQGHSHHLCVFSSGLASSMELEEHFRSIVSFIRKHRSALKILKQRGCIIEVSCGFASPNGQGGMVMDSRRLRLFGELSIDLIIDLFPPMAAPTT